MDSALPPIPAKRYFTIGEVSELCLVKPYVLRYWEQEFVQLKPMKRRGNRRYYQHHEVLLIRRIRELLYDQGFTISGARNRLSELGANGALPRPELDQAMDGVEVIEHTLAEGSLTVPDAETARAEPLRAAAVDHEVAWSGAALPDLVLSSPESVKQLREALLSIRLLLD